MARSADEQRAQPGTHEAAWASPDGASDGAGGTYPGGLLHLDSKRLARFERVGDRINGDRRGVSDGAGWEAVHVAVDDASRLAWVEVLPGEKRATVTGFLARALRCFRARGIRVELGMRDNGSGYVSRLFR